MSKIDKISAVIITYNEEKNIARLLDSLTFVDEIFISDGCSDDKTLEIAAKYNCKTYNRTKWHGFGLAKQEAVNLAENDWILAVDADEELSDELINEIKRLKETGTEYKAFRIKRKSFYLGKMINYSGWQNDAPLRLFNRKYGNYNSNIVHEFVEIDGKVSQIEAPLYHYTYPNIQLHIEKLFKYAKLGAEQNYKKNKKSGIFKAIFSGFFKFIKMYIIKLGFLDGKEGLVLALNSSYEVYLKYLLLWERLYK